MVSFQRWPRRIARGVAWINLGVSVVVLLGWEFQVVALQSVAPGLPCMAPLTALLLGAAATALLCSQQEWKEPRKERLAKAVMAVCAGSMVALGGLRLAGYLIHWDPGMDTLLFHPGSATSARVSPATAMDFMMYGMALWCLRKREFSRPFQVLTLGGGLVAWLGVSHYLYGGQPLLPYVTMAAHTAGCLLALSIGILCARQDIGLVALLVSDGQAGKIARGLVPATLLLPMCIGWMTLRGERHGYYGAQAAISLFAVVNIVLFGGLIWADAALLAVSDSERGEAEKRVRGQLARLKLLDRITRAVAEQEGIRNIYEVALAALEKDLPLDFGCICGAVESHERLMISRGCSVPEVACKAAVQELLVNADGQKRMIKGRAIYEPDLTRAARPFGKKLAQAGLKAIVTVPLAAEGRILGVLLAGRKEAQSFHSEDCEFLRQLSEHVALAAHHAELRESLQQAYNDLKETQQAVMQHERLRALGQMASGVAHDINNALSPVMLCAESLLENEKNISAKGRVNLQTIERAVGDVAKTVGRMREFYRGREPELPLVPVSLNAMVEQVIELTRARWSDMPQKRGAVVHLETVLTTDPPAVLGVECEIREALTNLIFNAVDAMPEGGTLTLRTKVTGMQSGNSPGAHTVQVEVSDTGNGMDAETRARCAEPFFTTKGDRGTGLGLAMVYGTMRRHGADLEIESEAGQGTMVRLSFAACRSSARQEPQVDVEPPRPQRKLRILVIDDDPFVARSLRDSLEGEGHSVFVAPGGEPGIEAFRTAQEIGQPFQVVMTDLGMPNVDGRRVAAAIKSGSPETPVILLTGWGQRLIDDGDIPAHVDHVLSKPAKLRELRAALAACVKGEAVAMRE